ncbi:hypothetical protein AQUCO_05200046v1 [Aquilegia coerulea]|uniref:Uncharacterized protein n=1 Tax=Aquilegia coerulea TaxID=218851 RepID=A0A2G5CIP4_AQUCA|nr:hypothetical protein AQUCO_05200046v1 [Aquilegia coerulea]
MVDLMGLSQELMSNSVVLVAQPFSLMRVVCMFGVRSVCLVTYIWLQLVRAIINVHMDLVWKIIVWTFAFVSLPVRILTALHRERLLEMNLREMRVELENLAWDRRELDERLQMIIKDCRIMGSIISELEEEKEKAVAKIALLENELQELKDENIRLIEIQRNTFEAKFDGRFKTVSYSDKQDTFVTEYDTSSLKPECIGSKEIIKDLLVHREAWEDENDRKAYPRGLFKIGSGDCQLVYPYSTGGVVDEAFNQHRKLAFSQSIFSAVLSLFVGMVIWKAKDPCMPLVMALFIVVGISFNSVIQFFSSVRNKLASDAVALLSFNSFILGMLTYPTLPLVTNVLVPLVLSLADGMLSRLGISLLWKG